jgi:hypothetical protein
MTADDTTLTVHLEAADEDSMQQIQDVITGDFERFRRRDSFT